MHHEAATVNQASPIFFSSNSSYTGEGNLLTDSNLRFNPMANILYAPQIRPNAGMVISNNPGQLNLDVSGSNKFGSDGTHSHQFTGSVNIDGTLSASLNVSASGFYGVDVRATEIHATTYRGTHFREANGNLEMQIAPGAVSILNDLKCGINANPDVFVVDRTPAKVGVNYNLGDLPDASFSVSGSTKLGEDIHDSHQFSGSVSIGNPENNSGINIYPNQTNQVTLQPKDTTNGRINIGTGLNQTLLISAKFAGSMYPAAGTNYQFGATSNKWGSICTNQLTASAVTMVDTTTPATLADAAYIYAKSGEMFVLDDSGNETQISPHDDNGEWQYFSKNTKTGKVVRVRMEKMIRRLEEITGESFIEEI